MASELKEKSINVSYVLVSSLLKDMGYSLQANQKVKEGTCHPDRNDPFEHIYAQIDMFQKNSQPVISIDTKKKELIGDLKNAKRKWRLKGKYEQVQVYDLPLETGNTDKDRDFHQM